MEMECLLFEKISIVFFLDFENSQNKFIRVFDILSMIQIEIPYLVNAFRLSIFIINKKKSKDKLNRKSNIKLNM